MKLDKIDVVAMRSAIFESLNEKATIVAEASIDVIAMQLQETKLAPDQNKFGMSKEQVHKLLTTRERHVGPHADQNADTNSSIEGQMKANYHQPESVADNEVDDKSVISAEATWNYDVVDMESQTPRRFAIDSAYTEGDDSSSNVGHICVGDESDSGAAQAHVDKAIASGSDIMFELGDGNHIVLDPHSLQGLKNSGKLACLGDILGSIEDFSNALGMKVGDESDV